VVLSNARGARYGCGMSDEPRYVPLDRKAHTRDGVAWTVWNPRTTAWCAHVGVKVDGEELALTQEIKPYRTLDGARSHGEKSESRVPRLTLADVPLWGLPLTPAVMRARRALLDGAPLPLP
jgi:hypothetical protein